MAEVVRTFLKSLSRLPFAKFVHRYPRLTTLDGGQCITCSVVSVECVLNHIDVVYSKPGALQVFDRGAYFT